MTYYSPRLMAIIFWHTAMIIVPDCLIGQLLFGRGGGFVILKMTYAGVIDLSGFDSKGEIFLCL